MADNGTGQVGKAADPDARSEIAVILDQGGADADRIEAVIAAGITGQQRHRSLPGQLRELGSTREVAQQLGVSQRTVQRWQAGPGHQRNKPSAANAEAIRQAVSTQRRDPERRREMLSTRRESRMRSYGASIRIKGKIAIGDSPIERGYWRHGRTINAAPGEGGDLPGDTAAAMTDAWLAGDDAKVADLIEAHYFDAYTQGTNFELGDLDRLDLRHHDAYN